MRADGKLAEHAAVKRNGAVHFNQVQVERRFRGVAGALQILEAVPEGASVFAVRFAAGFNGVAESGILLECAVFLIGEQPERAGFFAEAEIRIVLTQGEPVFRAAGEETVRFDDLLCDKIVDHNADVGFIASEFDGIESGCETGCIESGDEPLSGGLFVAAGSVDLSRMEQSRILFHSERA